MSKRSKSILVLISKLPLYFMCEAEPLRLSLAPDQQWTDPVQDRPSESDEELTFRRLDVADAWLVRPACLELIN